MPQSMDRDDLVETGTSCRCSQSLGARARKQRLFLLGLTDNAASLLLTLSATVLVIIAPCSPRNGRAHIGCQ